MAALTAASGPIRDNMGSLQRVKWTFTGVNDGDTFASGMSSVSDFYAQQTDNPTTQASAGLSAAESSGTFTFYPGEDGASVTLVVFHKG